MKTINESLINSLKLQVVMNGVWDIENAMENDISFHDHVSEQLLLDDKITKESLVDLIHEFYDFNEFGGLCNSYVSNLMDLMMPLHVRMNFINEVQEEMLEKACERINEK